MAALVRAPFHVPRPPDDYGWNPSPTRSLIISHLSTQTKISRAPIYVARPAEVVSWQWHGPNPLALRAPPAQRTLFRAPFYTFKSAVDEPWIAGMARSGGLKTTVFVKTPTPPVPTYAIYGVSLSPTTFTNAQIAAGATLNVFGTAQTNTSGNYIIHYHVLPTVAVDTPVTLVANVPQAVNISVPIPTNTPSGTYTTDTSFFSSDWVTLQYQFAVASFTVGGTTAIAVVVNPTGPYEVYTNPVTLAPNNTLNIFANITSNSSGDFAVEYNIREISNNNATNITVNAVKTFTANVPQVVNLNAFIPSAVPPGTYRVDVKIYPPDFSFVYSSAPQANIFHVQSSAITTLPMKLGVYRSAQDPVAIKIYENWLGRRTDYIMDTLPSGDNGDASLAVSWDKFVGSGWNFFASRWAGFENRLIMAVPMLPTQGNYGSPSLGATGAGAALANGASGSYDSYWITQGTNLVNAGYANNYIRLGWEMNGSWYNWSAVFNPSAWTTYFQRIVNILRATPGANFKFVFNPTLGFQNYDAGSVYPGDSYVDVIGLDIYDQDFNGYYPILVTDTPAQALAKNQAVWANDIVKSFNPNDMLYWKDFAITHTKPFMICEFGIYVSGGSGGGDDTYFIQQMHDFAETYNLAALCYFDYDGLQALFNSLLRPTQFPNSSALYQTLFGPSGS